MNLADHNPDIVEHLARLSADLAFIDCKRTGVGLNAATDLIHASCVAGVPCVVQRAVRRTASNAEAGQDVIKDPRNIVVELINRQ